MQILYTQGEFVVARKYFCKAAELSDKKNLRALFGVCMVVVLLCIGGLQIVVLLFFDRRCY